MGANKHLQSSMLPVVNQELQARLYEALFEAWCNEWWFGAIFWSGLSQQISQDLVEAPAGTGYEFVGKPAEGVLKKFWMAKEDCSPMTERAQHCEEVATWNGIWNEKQK